MNQDILLGLFMGILLSASIIMMFGKVLFGPWECFEIKNNACINWYKVDEQ